MKKTKGGIKMLHVIKDDFAESPEDIKKERRKQRRK